MHLELTMALPAAAVPVEDGEPSLMEDNDDEVAGEKTQNVCVMLSAPTAILNDLDMSKQVRIWAKTICIVLVNMIFL